MTMRETLYFYLFEKLVFLLDVALLAVSNHITSETLFWTHNAIMLLQSIGRLGFYSLIINAPDSVLPAALAEPKFYVLTSQFLEPRRPILFPSSKSSQVERKIVLGSSRRKYHLLGEPGPSNISNGLPSIDC